MTFTKKDVQEGIKKATQLIKGEKTELKPIHTSSMNTEKYMYEQGFNPETGSGYFIQWNILKGIWNKVDHFEHQGIIYKPIIGDELFKKAVILPVEPIEFGTETELDQEIIQHIRKWLDVKPEYERLALYNIKLSWIYQKFNCLNYTRALGDTGTGKSRFLFTLGHLHYKPMVVAGCLTPAVIFRIINKWKGTLLIDEGDQNSSDETNAFIKIMNCGFEEGMPVSRCDKNDPNTIDYFDVFCPKVLTTRKRFEDKATEARCMTNIMQQTGRTDIPDILTRDYFKKSMELRGKLLMWRFKNYNLIDPDKGLEVDLSKYEPRLRQVNRAFVGLFANKPDQLKEFLVHLDEYQETIIQERSESYAGLVVNVLAEQIIGGKEDITPSDIANSMNNDTEISLIYKATSQSVSKTLTGMGLLFKRQRKGGGVHNLLLLDKCRLQTIFSRYINNPNTLTELYKKCYDVTIVTSITRTAQFLKNDDLCQNADFSIFAQGHHYHRNNRNIVTHPNLKFAGYIPQKISNNPKNPEKTGGGTLFTFIKKSDVIQHLKKFGGKDYSLPIEELIEFFGKEVEDMILQLKVEGSIFEPRSGVVKVL